jgi:ribonucleoside-triphosphate reductase
MIRKIRKRDGTVQDFTPERIGEAIRKAAEAQGLLDFEGEARRMQELVVRRLEEKGYGEERPPSVEEIQDEVEAVLRDEGYGSLSERYHEYRKRHDELRRSRSTIFDVGSMVEEFVGGRDWRTKENANLRPSISSMMFNSAGAINARYLLDKVYPPEVSDSHVDGDLHLHDLYQGICGYCAGHSMEDILTRGLVSVGNNPYSRPPRHLDVALMQVVNYIGVMTQEWAGAQAFSWIDAYLAPFIREDGLTYKQLKQLLQMFVYNLNVTSRWGGQSPFSNVTLACGVPEPLRDRPVVVGGEPQGRTYEEYGEEIETFNKAFLEVLLEGDAVNRPFTFPIPTFAITRDFQWEEGLSDLLFKVAAKYGLPYFQNFVRSDLSPHQVYSMCCRLSLDLRELQRNVTGGLFGSSPKTGSVGVVTLNLSRAGYLAKGSEEELFRRLRYLCILAGRALEHKRKIVERNIRDGLLPYTREYFGDLRRHFSTVGVVGGHEMCLNMGIERGIASKEGAELCRRVLEFLREECRGLQRETGHLYNLEATPAEGVSYRLARLDRRKFGKAIRTSGEREPFYTNSTQLPVDSDLSLVKTLDHQEPLQTLYTGGTVLHVYLGEAFPDPRGLKEVLRRVCQGWRIPYYSITPTYSICPDHGYFSGEHPTCPTCGREADVYSRVVGYYRPVKNWNAGKQEEFRLRRKFGPSELGA